MPHLFKPIPSNQVHQLQLLDRSPVQTPIHTAAHTPCSTPGASPPATPRPVRARAVSNLANATINDPSNTTPTSPPFAMPPPNSSNNSSDTPSSSDAGSTNDDPNNTINPSTLHHVNRSLSLTSLGLGPDDPPPPSMAMSMAMTMSIPPLTLPVPLHQAPDYKGAAAEGVSHLDRSPVQTAFQTRVSSPNLVGLDRGMGLGLGGGGGGAQGGSGVGGEGGVVDVGIGRDERLVSHGVEQARVTVEALRERVGEPVGADDDEDDDTTTDDDDDDDNELSEVASESLEIEGYVSSGQTSDADIS